MPPRIAVIIVLLLAAAKPGAQSEAGIAGVVLTPDGAPATGGNVALVRGPDERVSATIDRDGRFHLVPQARGRQSLFISVPGLAPFRVSITVPASRKMTLPTIQLLPGTYLRARFVTTGGESLAPTLRRRSVDAAAAMILDPLSRAADQIDSDGTITIGPLPLGRTLLVFDRPPLAQTRVPDVIAGRSGGLQDRGTIVIQPGAALHVDVVDAAGAPVPRHDVWMEEAVEPRLLFFPMMRTNDEGRVTFTRLAPGRYRVWTRTADRCGNQQLTVSKLVAIRGSDADTRIVVGGRATFRFTWPLGALSGRAVSASPDTPSSPPPWVPPAAVVGAASCGGMTDADGRLTLDGFPPGAARVTVSMFNSTFSRIVTVPTDGREIAIEVPDGLLPVRVVDQATTQPVASARLTWMSSGGIVETITNPNGDALLEGTGMEGGRLRVNARDYEAVEGNVDEGPGAHQELSLKPRPPRVVSVRVVAASGEPVSAAVVHLLSAIPDAGEIAATDEKGMVTFLEVGPGGFRLSVSADGFANATVQISEDDRRDVMVTLSRQTRQP